MDPFSVMQMAIEGRLMQITNGAKYIKLEPEPH